MWSLPILIDFCRFTFLIFGQGGAREGGNGVCLEAYLPVVCSVFVHVLKRVCLFTSRVWYGFGFQ